MHTFYFYLEPLAIVNLIFLTVRLENFMTSCRDKLYHHTLRNKIKFNFLIILFGKIPSSISRPSSGTESEIERMNEKIWLVTIHSWTDKIKSSSSLWQEFCEWSGQQQWCNHKWCEWQNWQQSLVQMWMLCSNGS